MMRTTRRSGREIAPAATTALRHCTQTHTHVTHTHVTHTHVTHTHKSHTRTSHTRHIHTHCTRCTVLTALTALAALAALIVRTALNALRHCTHCTHCIRCTHCTHCTLKVAASSVNVPTAVALYGEFEFGLTTVVVQEQRIEDSTTHAVINAANEASFQMGDTGVSKALRDACGGESACGQQKSQHCGTSDWEAVSTTPRGQATWQRTAGMLADNGVRCVVHAHGPRWTQPGGPKAKPLTDESAISSIMQRDIKLTVGNALECAARSGAMSVTVPPISGGIFTRGTPNKENDELESRRAVLEALFLFAKENPNRLRRIVFVDIAPSPGGGGGRSDLLHKLAQDYLRMQVCVPERYACCNGSQTEQ